ncbi:MAG: hypothetical protein Q9169_001138 [Polycauliona sp. 2 TL-2023]
MAARNALPAHLKSSAMSNGDAEGAFQQKHHGKSQSHVWETTRPWIRHLSAINLQQQLLCPSPDLISLQHLRLFMGNRCILELAIGPLTIYNLLFFFVLGSYYGRDYV